MKRPSPHSCCRKKSVPPPLAGGGECCERSEKHSGEGALLTDPSPKFFAADAARICPLPRGEGGRVYAEVRVADSKFDCCGQRRTTRCCADEERRRSTRKDLETTPQWMSGFSREPNMRQNRKTNARCGIRAEAFRLPVRCPSRDSRPSFRADSWAGICGRCCAAPSPSACAADCADTWQCDG